MPNPSVRLFLSCVSDEFGAYRDALRHALTRPNVEVKIQEDFKALGGDTLKMLAEYVEQCEAIVHFLGDMAGSTPAVSSVDDLLKRRPELEMRLAEKGLGRGALRTLTYPQWEAWLAIGFGKDLLIVEPAENSARGPKYKPTNASRVAQAQHLKRLRAINRYPVPFKNEDNLVAQIYGTAVIGALVKAGRIASASFVSNIPIRVPEHFLGRDEALAEIDLALKRNERRVAITTLHGMRGVGKTVLAAAYAERHRADYRATWWIRAETPGTLRADLISLGVRLGWVADDEKEDAAVGKVRERLRDEGEGLLLIYDNAIDAASIRAFLPAGGTARALITSNAHAWRGLATPVEISVWPKKVGADFLVARAGRADEGSDAGALSQELGGLPLAHEQAAAYCERLGLSFPEYRKRFKAAPTPLLDTDKDASADYHGGLTVAKTFALAIEEAAKLHPAAEPLITYAALLAPEPIPVFLFSEAREKLGEPIAFEVIRDGLDEAIAALCTFALVERETIADEIDPLTTTKTIRIHRLVRMVAFSRLSEERIHDRRRVLIEAMTALYPSFLGGDPAEAIRGRRLDSHVVDLLDTDPIPLGTEQGLVSLSRRIVSCQIGQSRARWLSKLEGYVIIGETALQALVLMLQEKGDLGGARIRQELAAYERFVGFPGAETSAMEYRALVHIAEDRPDEALELIKLALAGHEERTGVFDRFENGRAIAVIAIIGAAALEALGRSGEAAAVRKLFQRQRI